MRSNLVAASEEDLSPEVSSSPRVKQPGCPPGRKSGSALDHSGGILRSQQHPHRPSKSRDRRGKEPQHKEEGTETGDEETETQSKDHRP